MSKAHRPGVLYFRAFHSEANYSTRVEEGLGLREELIEKTNFDNFTGSFALVGKSQKTLLWKL